ncbi:hypothetical protein BOX15_Mlig024572g1, partial [Macrostomum lignano]
NSSLYFKNSYLRIGPFHPSNKTDARHPNSPGAIMISRTLLMLSCGFGLLIGGGFIAGGIYGTSNPDLVSDLSKKIDLSAVPQVEKIKNDVVTKLNESGILAVIWNTFLITGAIVVCICGLGFLAALTAMKILLVLYILAQGLMLTLFVVIFLLLLDEDSIIGRKLTDKMVEAQERKFYSVVDLLNNKASDGAFVTVLINVLQVMIGCCGAREVGDIRNSSSWQSSNRGLAELLKLDKNNSKDESSGISGMFKGVMSDDTGKSSTSTVPDWLKNRIPPGATLPPNVNLPDKIPDGLVIPKDFNITDLNILKNVSAIRQFFEDTLVLLTPISCCQFKDQEAIFKLKPKELVANMKDPDCPFSPHNGPGVHTQTCYKKIVQILKGYSAAILIAGVIIGLFMEAIFKLKPKELVANMKDPDCPFSPHNGPGVHTQTCYKKIVQILKGYSAAILIAGVIIGLFMSCNLSLAFSVLFCG